MKKILLIGLLLNIMSLVALDIGPILGFKAGYNLDYRGELEGQSTYLEYDYADSLSIQVTTGIRVEGFRIIGIYENVMLQYTWNEYIPIQDQFTVKISYSFLDFEIGFEHTCNHPVITQLDERNIESNSGRRYIYLSYYKEF